MFAEAEFWDLFDDFCIKLNNHQFVRKYKHHPEAVYTFYPDVIEAFSSRYSGFRFKCYSIKKETRYRYYIQVKNPNTEFWIECQIPQTGKCHAFEEHFSGGHIQENVIQAMKNEFLTWIAEQNEHRLAFATGNLVFSESEVG